MKHELTTEQLEQVKREHPEFFIPNNKWYRSSFGSLVYKIGDSSGYGFESDGSWYYNDSWCFTSEWERATEQEIKQALLKEAEKRGYDKGVKIKTRDDKYHILSGVNFSTNTTSLIDTDYCGTYIFHEGEWCEIITPSSDIHTDIQALKDKYTDYNFTIIAEKR